MDDFNSIDTFLMDHIQAHVGIRDGDGRLIYMNSHALLCCGFKSLEECKGTGYEELPFAKSITSEFRDQDRYALSLSVGESLSLVDKVVNKGTGSIEYLITNKTPLKNSKNQTIGIMHQGMTLPKGLYLKVKSKSFYLLSRREQQVAELLLSGNTAKMTANILSLSHRTVESYLEQIKNKLGVQSRSEIFTELILDLHREARSEFSFGFFQKDAAALLRASSHSEAIGGCP